MTYNSSTPPSLAQELPAKLKIVNAGVRAFTKTLYQDISPDDDYLQAAIGSYVSLLEQGGNNCAVFSRSPAMAYTAAPISA